MGARRALPEGYKEIFSVNLQKDKKIAIFINALALLISAVMIIPMHFYISIETLFDMSQGLDAYAFRFFCLMGLIVIYMVLHELVHGITM